MKTNNDLPSSLIKFVKPFLLLMIFLVSTKVQAYRYDFEKEGFAVHFPLGYVTVEGDHFFECYEPLYEGSTTKKLNYTLDFTSKYNHETELDFLIELKNTLPSDNIIREDLSNIKTTRNGYPYRSLKIKQGNLMMNYYFFFRKDDLVVFSFQGLLAHEDWLSNDINAAVDNFIWLEQTIDVKEIDVRFKVPYELNSKLNDTKNKVTFSLTDPEYAKKTNFGASVEFIPINGKIDSASVRKAIDTELKAQASTYTYDYHVFGMNKFNKDLVCDKYVLYYNEKGNEELMKMSIYQFYTTKGIIRFIHTEYYSHIGKLSKYIENVLASLKYLG
jgi:hypothetical protein